MPRNESGNAIYAPHEAHAYRAKHIRTFDSMHALMREIESKRAYRADPWNNGERWIDSLTHEDAVSFCHHGNPRMVPATEDMLRRFENVLPTLSYEPLQDVAGAFPNVADFLASEPECMTTMRMEELDTGPVNIGVCLESGCRQCYNINCTTEPIEASAYKLKGTAILALVLRIAAVRPVNLYAISSTNTHDSRGDWLERDDMGRATTGPWARRVPRESFNICMVRINTTPLDVASAAFALSHIGFPRAVCYAHQQISGGGTCFPMLQDAVTVREGHYMIFRDSTDHEQRYAERIRQILQWDAADSLIIPPTQSKFRNAEQAIAWTLKNMARFAPRHNV